MKRISIISALLLAVLMAGCAAATAPCDAQTPELPPQAEVAMDSEGIGEIQERLWTLPLIMSTTAPRRRS